MAHARFVAVGVAASVLTKAQVIGDWIQLQDCPAKVSATQEAAEIGGAIYVAGGQDKRTWVYDVDTDTWPTTIATESQMPVATDHARMVSVGGMLLMFGGKVGTHPSALPNDEFINNIYSMQPSLEKQGFWRLAVDYVTSKYKAGDLPSPRNAHSIVYSNGFIWLFGGWNSKQYMNDMYAFNLALLYDAPDPSVLQSKQFWESTDADKEAPPRRNGASLVAFGGGLYLFGGFSHDVETNGPNVGCDKPEHKCIYYNDLWRFCTRDRTWLKIEGSSNDRNRAPPPRSLHSAAILGRSMFVFGGSGGAYATFQDLWEYKFVPGLSSTSGSWKLMEVAHKPPPSLGQSMVAVRGSLYVIGGMRNVWDAEGAKTVWTYRFGYYDDAEVNEIKKDAIAQTQRGQAAKLCWTFALGMAIGIAIGVVPALAQCARGGRDRKLTKELELVRTGSAGSSLVEGF